MENKAKRSCMAMIVILSLFLLTGCFNFWWEDKNKTEKPEVKIESGDTEWKFTKNIQTPITWKTSSDSELKLGDLATNKIEITLPKWATDIPMDVKLENPTEVPKIMWADFKTIWAPIDISSWTPTRLNEKATIKLAFNKDELPIGTTTWSLRVVYFDWQKRESIKPDKIDMEKWVVTFSSYHFSFRWLNKIDSKRKITEEWIHSKTLDDELKKKINKTSDHVANQIIDLTLQRMWLNDKDLKTQILKEVLKDDSYKSIYDASQKWEVVDMSQKIALLAWKKIAQNVPAWKLQAGLARLTKDSALKWAGWWFTSAASDVEAVGKAAWYVAEWRYEDAAKILGSKVIDKFLIGKAWKIAVEVIDYQIWAWKNSEVEAAYNAYKDWANGKFWWYNVDKWDFDWVRDQMRWIRRQLELEGIKNENIARRDAWLPELTEAQWDMVREWIKESFRRQFAVRNEREEIFKKKEEILNKLVDSFDKADFFDTTKRPAWLDKWLDYENELNVLYHFAEKIMKDTKRPELSDLNWLIMDGKISTDDIVQWARMWFSEPDGPKKYADFLKNRFNIVLAPDLANLAGIWTSWSMTINDVILSEKMLAEVQSAKSKSKSNWWCDIAVDLRQMKWKTVPATVNINPNWTTGWSMSLSFNWDWTGPFNFTYANWTIKWTISKDWATWDMSLQVSEEQLVYISNWILNLSINWWEAKIIVGLRFYKQKPVAKPK